MALGHETRGHRSTHGTPGSRARVSGRLLAGVAVCVLTVWLALTAVLFLWPPSDDPRPVDAVVPLAGPDRNRLDVARALVAAQPDAALVLSVGSDRRVIAACARPPDHIHCFRADPLRTRGEARALGELARRHGWDSMAVVTSTTHITRARMLVEQCVDGDVVMIDAGRWRGELPGRLLREWGGLLGTVTFDRAC